PAERLRHAGRGADRLRRGTRRRALVGPLAGRARAGRAVARRRRALARGRPGRRRAAAGCVHWGPVAPGRRGRRRAGRTRRRVLDRRPTPGIRLRRRAGVRVTALGWDELLSVSLIGTDRRASTVDAGGVL